jgi:hypothetical protein
MNVLLERGTLRWVTSVITYQQHFHESYMLLGVALAIVPWNCK